MGGGGTNRLANSRRRFSGRCRTSWGPLERRPQGGVALLGLPGGRVRVVAHRLMVPGRRRTRLR